jgi:hypothetical protein
MIENENARAKRSVAEQLRELGVKGILVPMAERGQIVELRCEMPTCYCPEGRTHFVPRAPSAPHPDWAPNADHHPQLKMEDGQLRPWNVRLSHVLCNQEDRPLRLRIRRMLEDAPTISFEVIAEMLNSKRVRPPARTKKWSSKAVRRAYVS